MIEVLLMVLFALNTWAQEVAKPLGFVVGAVTSVVLATVACLWRQEYARASVVLCDSYFAGSGRKG